MPLYDACCSTCAKVEEAAPDAPIALNIHTDAA